MDKRAQGLSINVIIIVAIALIVLVVLIAVFTGRMGTFVGGVNTAVTCGEACIAAGYTGVGSTPVPGLKDGQGKPCSCGASGAAGGLDAGFPKAGQKVGN